MINDMTSNLWNAITYQKPSLITGGIGMAATFISVQNILEGIAGIVAILSAILASLLSCYLTIKKIKRLNKEDEQSKKDN